MYVTVVALVVAVVLSRAIDGRLQYLFIVLIILSSCPILIALMIATLKWSWTMMAVEY